MSDFKTRVADGALARMGLLDEGAIDRAAELLARVAASDLETVRVLFADQHGILRGKTVVADALVSAFTSGIALTSTLLLKDTAHRTVFPIWEQDGGGFGGVMRGGGDFLLVPDPATFRVLPWSPHSAWILSDPVFRSGAAIPFSPRGVLKSAVARLEAQSLRLVTGLEVEFHVFEVVDPRREHGDASFPAAPPLTRNIAPGYQYLTEIRYSMMEPVIDDLRRACQQIGLPVRSTEVEMGPSQIEFTFDPDTALAHADNMVMFRTLVKEVCERRGLHATFMCRPRVDNAAASGWHVHQSLVDTATGRNVMIPGADGALTPQASGWIAGLLDHAAASCVFTTPTVNGYKRYRPQQLAPDRIQWARDNRGAMIRSLMVPGDAASRIENRVPEPAANPYYVFAAQILAGLDGINRGLTAPDPVETPYDTDAPALPASLIAAVEAFEASSFFNEALGDVFVDYLSHLKRAEWARYLLTVSEWEQTEYFSIF